MADHVRGNIVAVPARIVMLEGKEVRLPAEDAEDVAGRINRGGDDFVAVSRDDATVWINRRNILYVEDASQASLVAAV